MSYSNNGQVISLKANASIAAHRVVGLHTANVVKAVVTSSVYPIGVTADFAESSGSCPIVISGIAKCYCSASIPAGALVCMATDSAGQIMNAATANATATSTNISVVGIALEAGSAGSIIPVLLQIASPFAR